MKKVLSIVLAIAMIATMSAVAFAAEITAADGSTTFDVNGKYVAVADTDNYKVDVTWSNPEFVYSDAGTHWDVENHVWVTDTAAKWDGEGTITLLNHSSKGVTATATYAANGNASDMDFSGAAVLTAWDAETEADAGTITCTMKGTIENTEVAKIGTITVTLS